MKRLFSDIEQMVQGYDPRDKGNKTIEPYSYSGFT